MYLFKRKNKRPGEVCSLNQGQSTLLHCFVTHMKEERERESDRDTKSCRYNFYIAFIRILPLLLFVICYFICLIVCVYLPVVGFFFLQKNFFFVWTISSKLEKVHTDNIVYQIKIRSKILQTTSNMRTDLGISPANTVKWSKLRQTIVEKTNQLIFMEKKTNRRIKSIPPCNVD